MSRKFIWTSPLLNEEDRLFRSDCDDMRNNAILSYGEADRFAIYNLGYLDAAELLVQSYLENDRPKDRLVYPIIFLYRQYLELKLKEFISGLNYCINQDGNFPTLHDLSALWAEFIRLYTLKEPKFVIKRSFSDAGKMINEFNEYDPYSMTYRYPLDKMGNVSKKPRLLNVRNLAYLIEKLKRFLQAISEKIDNFKIKSSTQYDDDMYV